MRYFSVVFDGGFIVERSIPIILDMMPEIANIHIREFVTSADAYVQAYNEYQFRSGGATVPTYEEIMKCSLFFAPNYVPPMLDECRRIFAVMHPWYVGIMTDEKSVADVLNRLPFAEVVEAVSLEDAKAIIGYWYARQHSMEVATYQRMPICPDLPLDVMTLVITIPWFANLVQEQYGYAMTPALQATASLKLETPRDKELFEDLKENELPKTIRLIVYQNGKPVV